MLPLTRRTGGVVSRVIVWCMFSVLVMFVNVENVLGFTSVFIYGDEFALTSFVWWPTLSVGVYNGWVFVCGLEVHGAIVLFRNAFRAIGI